METVRGDAQCWGLTWDRDSSVVKSLSLLPVFLLGWMVKDFLLFGGHVYHEVHHSVSITIVIVISGNELYKVVIESHASLIIKGRRVDVTIKVTGDNLILSVAKDALSGPCNPCLTTFLMSSYLAAFSGRMSDPREAHWGQEHGRPMPMSFLFSPGMTLSTTLAAPVDARMIFWAAPWLPCYSFSEEPSTVF